MIHCTSAYVLARRPTGEKEIKLEAVYVLRYELCTDIYKRYKICFVVSHTIILHIFPLKIKDIYVCLQETRQESWNYVV